MKHLKLPKTIETLLILACLLWPSNINAQANPFIDSLLEKTHIMYRNGEFKRTINSAFTILEHSQKQHYEKGEVRSLIYIADCLMQLDQYEKSNEYVEKAEQHSAYFKTRPYDEWLVKKIKLDNYRLLGLNTLFKKEFYRSMEIANSIQTPIQKGIAQYNMYLIAESLDDNPDTIYHYLTLAKRVVESAEFSKDKEEYVRQNRTIVYLNLGDHFFSTSQMDSAAYYYNLCSNTSAPLKENLYAGHILAALSKIDVYSKDYNAALAKMELAFAKYSEQNLLGEMTNLSREMADAYLLAGNKEKGIFYKEKYDSLQKALQSIKLKSIDNSILDIINKHEEALKIQKDNSSKITYLIILLGLAVITLMTYMYIRYKRKKDRIVQSQQANLDHKEDELNHRELKIQELNHKVTYTKNILEEIQRENQTLRQNDGTQFESLLDMARENHPQFWIRFNELYPEVQEKLLKIIPGIKATELTLAGYIYLGFSTKEIADYTFKSPKTIENNRSNLRKKLNIPANKSFSVWLNNLDS